jgi:hypothetical protein
MQFDCIFVQMVCLIDPLKRSIDDDGEEQWQWLSKNNSNKKASTVTTP